MLPAGHAAVGYVLYSWRCRRRGGRPSGLAAVAVLFGTQLPDLVDKPLSWHFGVLPTGRTLAHSLLVAALVVGIAWYVVPPARREPVAALGIGWVSHTAADLLPDVVAWRPASLGTVLWPVTPVQPYETEPSFVSQVAAVDPTTVLVALLVEGTFATVTLVVWHRDGRPGSGTLRNVVSRAFDR